jgi:hypothetical protein
MKDHGNYDFDHRKKYSPRRKMRAYGEQSGNSVWAFDRKQNTSSIMRRHYLKHTHTRKRQILKEELNNILEDILYL